MEIRKRITYQFLGIVAILLLFSLVTIYFSFSQTRKEEFYDRLGSKAKLVAQMLIDIAEIDSELLKRIEKNNPLNLANEKIVIFNFQDERIYSTDEDNYLNLSPALIQEVRIKEEKRLKQGTYEIYGQYYEGQADKIVVFAAATDIFGKNKLKWLRIIIVLVFILSLVFVYFAGRLFASKALAPISNIVEQVNRIEANNLNARLDEGSEKDEISRLAKTFNKMLERLELAFKTQKNFIANASHELRTPLTVITGQLEVILMKARTNKEYINTLNLVLNEIKDINTLSNKLLLLAQTSIDSINLSFSPVRIDDVLWECRKRILNRGEHNSVDIFFGEGIDDDSKMQVLGNELLLKTAVINLIDNACKYSSKHHAEVQLDANENFLTLKFIDQGVGISPKELNMIFQPFFRSKNVIGTYGHGIGLSLVEKIISLHQGTIRVSSELDKGTVFTLRFPVFKQKTSK